MDWIATPDIWLSLLTLIVLEVVLGIDNLVVIAILSGRLPPEQQRLARRLGLAAALLSRLALLFALTWMMGLTASAFAVFGKAFSWRDLMLIAGGLFLLFKAFYEVHHTMEVAAGARAPNAKHAAFWAVVSQIAVVDIVFSLDSVITAVGTASRIEVMIAAIVVAMAVMVAASEPIARFIARHPSVKMLALGFLMLIGVMLVADGIGHHLPKGYLYFAMAFAIVVEALNMLTVRRKNPAPPPAAG
jgi:predicted tellurium resistance membrane protein TerC